MKGELIMNPCYVYDGILMKGGCYPLIENDNVGGVWKYSEEIKVCCAPYDSILKQRTAKYPRFMEVKWERSDYHSRYDNDTKSHYFLKDAKTVFEGEYYYCFYDLNTLDGIYKAIEFLYYEELPGQPANPYGDIEYLQTRAIVNFPWIEQGLRRNGYMFNNIPREELTSWLDNGWETHPIIIEGKYINEYNYKKLLGYDNYYLEFEYEFNPGVKYRVSFGNEEGILDAVRFLPWNVNPLNFEFEDEIYQELKEEVNELNRKEIDEINDEICEMLNN